MNKQFVHHERAAALTVAIHNVGFSNSVIKLGLDIHAKLYVVAAQYDHALPKPPRRFEPQQFVPWVESLLPAGHQVHVVYEACSPVLLLPLVPYAAASAGSASGSTASWWPRGRTAT
jgi:hypothetical protein